MYQILFWSFRYCFGFDNFFLGRCIFRKWSKTFWFCSFPICLRLEKCAYLSCTDLFTAHFNDNFCLLLRHCTFHVQMFVQRKFRAIFPFFFVLVVTFQICMWFYRFVAYSPAITPNFFFLRFSLKFLYYCFTLHRTCVSTRFLIFFLN